MTDTTECPECDGVGIIGFPDGYDEYCPLCCPSPDDEEATP